MKINFLSNTGLANNHKVAVLDHVRATNFGVHNVSEKIPRSKNQASYLLPSDFPNNHS